MEQFKIGITGAECSGKSTLAKQLANHFGVSYVKEFAVEYLDSLNHSYTQDDLYIIAKGQQMEWKFSNDQVLIADTELLVIAVWSEVVYGRVSEELEALLRNQQFDHYFLCKPDIPWEAGPYRVNPNDRDELFKIYQRRIDELGWNYTLIEGNEEERFSLALDALKDFSFVK